MKEKMSVCIYLLVNLPVLEKVKMYLSVTELVYGPVRAWFSSSPVSTVSPCLLWDCLLSLPPASRAKLSMINTMSKIRGQEKGPGYPQAEALLAEAMLKFGRELGDDCNFGNDCFPHLSSFICPRGFHASKTFCRRWFQPFYILVPSFMS